MDPMSFFCLPSHKLGDWEPTSLEKVGGLSTMSMSKNGLVSKKRCRISKRVESKDSLRLYVLTVRQHEACLIGMYPMDWSTPYKHQLSGRGAGAYPNDPRFDWKDWVCAPKMGKLIPCVYSYVSISDISVLILGDMRR